MQASLGQSYTIEHELGGGGMSRVYVAVERDLGRRVVIKLLSPDLAAGVSARRFGREIRLAASLQQANIVPVLSAGEADGLPYYTMPFVEGLSLRDRLARATGGRLPISEAISVLRDVARALAYAHDHGVVHRDIKPANVLLSGDAAVVTDFGIAKAISAARSANDTRRTSGGSTVTRAGTALGTPAYMAPEQVTADPDTDHRADLYSFGCLAYELLAGATPFGARPAHQLLAAHVVERPAPIVEQRSDCPANVAAVIMQCLEKDPLHRPQSARELLPAFDAVTPTSGPPPAFRRRTARRPVIVALAIAGTLVFAAGIASAWARWWGRPADGVRAVRSVAVLPFDNVGGDSTQEYLADGIADGLTTALGKIGGIRIVSRTLSHRYRGQRALDVREVGTALGTDHLVQGNLRRVGNRLRVSVQLTSARDSSEVWSETYERDAVDAFAVPDSIAHDIAVALHAPPAPRRLASISPARSAGTSSPEAYDLYLRGRYLLQRRGPRVQQAVEKFEQAIARDSGFARAHAGLSAALELLPYFTEVTAAAVRDRAISAARRALSLDSTLAEAHTSLALAHGHAYEWRLAGEEHRRAIAVDSTDASAHMQYGRYLHDMGRLTDAHAEFARARALDPYFAVASGWLAHELWLAGRTTDALAEVRRAMELDSAIAPVRTFALEIYLTLGRYAEARALMRGFPQGSPTWAAVLARGHIELGDTASAQALLRELESRRPPPAKVISALGFIYLALGDTARAITAFERATDAGEPWPTDVSISEPEYDSIRASARFAALLRRIGLDVKDFAGSGERGAGSG